jgi:dipeptidase D
MQENKGPKDVLRFFEEISRIPRGSGNEKGISDYLVAFAKERGLWVQQDKSLNVVIKKPGTGGHEKAKPVIIQAHMDMVCEKNSATVHDFLSDPIKLVVDGDFLKADGTTLGADNGAALAMALALLDGKDIPHPPLEILVTTSEEIGLLGAGEIDGSLFEGRILLNMDSDAEGVFCVSCAGGGTATLSYKPEYTDLPAGFVTKTLKVKGLKGGHSGVDITKERANSNRLMARALRLLQEKFAVLFCDLNGGAKDNAIPRETQAVIAFDAAKSGDVAGEVKTICENFKREYSMSDGGLEFCMEDCGSSVKKVFSGAFCGKVISAIMMLPNGIQAMSLVFDNLPETSLNVGVVCTDGDSFFLTCSLRSSFFSKRQMLIDQVKIVAEATGGDASFKGLYPAWEYNEKSALRKKAMGVFSQMFGKEAVISGTHGGLECGIFCEKIKGVDIVSFGPDIHDMHTPGERISLSSYARTWDFLKKLLPALAE